jgi:outer membrane receptor for ferrienterochelin and colicins
MKVIITGALLLFAISTYAQLKGVVVGANEGKRTPIKGAKINLLKNGSATSTNEDGTFELILPKDLPDTLVIKAIGYYPDSVPVSQDDRFISMQITLYSEKLLPEIVLGLRKETHSISRMKTLHVEELTAGELRKAACCNLSESFETNASVDVNITDAVSGAKKIQLMGLDGVYTQIQFENIPYLRGLESAFGLTSIPGTWIESIQITKGSGTVVNGYESMAGLVNLELKKPTEMERLFVNGYGNIFGRAELNMNAGQVINDKWSSGTLAHASGMFGEMDSNRDGFRDIPMSRTAALINRWSYQGKKMESQFGFNAYIDEKLGGQNGYSMHNPGAKYGVHIDSKHADVFVKTGFFMRKPYNSIGVVYNLKYHSLHALFGVRSFIGEEKRGYVNAIYDGIIRTTDHKIKIGASFIYTDIRQQQDSLNADRIDLVPGIFTEYTYTGMRLSNVLGLRLDHHPVFGFQFIPRWHAKYTLTEFTDLRFTAGKGWRVPNYLIDNVSLLASGKSWEKLDDLNPEVSWNLGGSVVHNFKLFGQNGSWSADLYHTRFENQLIVDREGNTIKFMNQEGGSFSNALQTELSFSPKKNWDVRLAYKFLDVKALYAGKMQQQVMIPKHRALFNSSYLTRNKRWQYDLSFTLFGDSRLPGTNEVGAARLGKTYVTGHTQVTHTFKKWEFYIGVENLTNYRQKNPILVAENPFSTTFDATQIWGPVMGTMIYTGFRYAMKREKKKE